LQSKDISEIDSVTQKMYSLINYRSGLIKEIQNLHVKRRNLVVETRNLTERIRITRDSLNKGYQVYKDTRRTRSENLSKIRELRTKMNPVEETLKKIEKNINLKEGENLAERLKAADWKLQTEKITKEEEKTLVETIKDLESKLRKWKKVNIARTEISKLRTEMSKYKSNLDKISKSNESVEKELDSGKDRLTSDVKTRDQLFKEMEEINIDIAELEKSITKSEEQITELKNKRLILINDTRNIELETVKSKEKEMLKKAKAAAKDKVSKGEKLTFDELKLAFDEE